MRYTAIVYIINYVIVTFVVYSPLTDFAVIDNVRTDGIQVEPV